MGRASINKSLIILALACAFLAADSRGANADRPEPAPQATEVAGLKLMAGLPDDQVERIKRGFDALKRFDFSPKNTAAIRRIMGIREVNEASLLAWLDDRVQAVVGESYDIDDHLIRQDRCYRYAEGGVLPELEQIAVETGDSSERVAIVMRNVGVSAYYDAKRSDRLTYTEIPGIGKLPITSPRVGIIQIGESLFDPDNQTSPKRPEAAGNSVYMLSSFFHEARHSDGHGKTMGFFHAACPKGHSLEGTLSCDRSLNGPYAVDAAMTEAMLRGCPDCTASDREQLRTMIADYHNRILPRRLDGKRVRFEDDAPEGTR
jgi:hypothetical protein